MKDLVFQGYWRDETATGVPDSPGIYCIYGGKFDEVYVYPEILIYIGESSNVRLKIAKHDKEILKSYLNFDQILMYTFAQTNSILEENSTSEIERRLFENQLIFDNKPVANANQPECNPGVSLTLLGHNQLLKQQQMNFKSEEDK